MCWLVIDACMVFVNLDIQIQQFNSKVKQMFNENVKFIKRYKTNKLEMFCFVVTRIIFSFNRKLMLFIELRVQVVTISTLEKLTEI